MAEAGGICISGRAYDQVANKLGLEYENLGEHQVKNISTPIRVFRVLSFPGAAAHRVVIAKAAVGKKWRKIVFSAAAVIVAVVVVLGIWQFYQRQSMRVEAASIEKMAYPLPEKPSIAVMPFVNLSGEAEQEYLANSISENLISCLSQLPKVFIIARSSMFAYKGKAVKVKQVSEELGVQYVVEGSVQRSGDRVRITAQLVDAIKGYHLWSDRFDKDLTDIFALQDEIALNILKAIQLEVPKVFSAGVGRGTNNLQAYLKFLRGYDHIRAVSESFDQRELKLAKRLFEEAIALDEKYAKAYVMLGFTYVNEVTFGWSKSPKESFTKALELANKSLALDPDHPGGHGLLSYIFLYTGQYDQAVAESKQALEIDPYAAVLEIAGFVFTYSGLFEEAIAVYEKLLRLDPHAHEHIYDAYINAHFLTGQFEKSIPLCIEAAKRWPNGYVGYGSLAVAYSALGRQEEAREAIIKSNEAIIEFKKAHPVFANRSYGELINWYLNSLPFKDESDRERLRALITKRLD
jgi:TolB-like protein/Tfp pilus assembly protein PilF